MLQFWFVLWSFVFSFSVDAAVLIVDKPLDFSEADFEENVEKGFVSLKNTLLYDLLFSGDFVGSSEEFRFHGHLSDEQKEMYYPSAHALSKIHAAITFQDRVVKKIDSETLEALAFLGFSDVPTDLIRQNLSEFYVDYTLGTSKARYYLEIEGVGLDFSFIEDENFWVAKTLVTKEFFRAVNPNYELKKDEEKIPVTSLLNDEISDFIDTLNDLLKVQDFQGGITLPHQGEWQAYAGDDKYVHYDDDSFEDYAWINKDWNSRSIPYPVGLKKPGYKGLFDVFGNVEEILLTSGREMQATGGDWRSMPYNVYVVRTASQSCRCDSWGFRLIRKMS